MLDGIVCIYVIGHSGMCAIQLCAALPYLGLANLLSNKLPGRSVVKETLIIGLTETEVK